MHPREPYTFYGLSKLLGEEMVKFYGRSEKNLATSIAVFSHVEAAHELIDPNGEYSSAAFYVNGRFAASKPRALTTPERRAAASWSRSWRSWSR